MLTENDYPPQLGKRLTNRYNSRLDTQSQPADGNNDVISRHSLQFVQTISPSIARSLTKNCDNMCIAFKNSDNVVVQLISECTSSVNSSLVCSITGDMEELKYCFIYHSNR